MFGNLYYIPLETVIYPTKQHNIFRVKVLFIHRTWKFGLKDLGFSETESSNIFPLSDTVAKTPSPLLHHSKREESGSSQTGNLEEVHEPETAKEVEDEIDQLETLTIVDDRWRWGGTWRKGRETEEEEKCWTQENQDGARNKEETNYWSNSGIGWNLILFTKFDISFNYSCHNSWIILMHLKLVYNYLYPVSLLNR